MKIKFLAHRGRKLICAFDVNGAEGSPHRAPATPQRRYKPAASWILTGHRVRARASILVFFLPTFDPNKTKFHVQSAHRSNQYI